MPMIDLTRVLAQGNVEPPASEESIAAIRALIGTIPKPLESLWKHCDGLLLDSGSGAELQED
jgi:hypothetical protein